MCGTPFYNRNGITIYCGDCIEVLPTLDFVFDAVITDLPYGTTSCIWDSPIPLDFLWTQYSRLLKETGVCVLTASQPFTTRLVSSNYEWFKYNWVWNKVGGANFMNLDNRPWKTHEDILIFAPGNEYTFNPIKTLRADSSLQRDPIGKKRKLRRLSQTKIQHYNVNQRFDTIIDGTGLKHPVDIITFSIKESSDVKHPTKKPVGLMAYLIQTYTNESELIIDNTMGSGTTLVAAQNLGRRAIGIEIDEEYCKMAASRLRQRSIFNFMTENKPELIRTQESLL